MNGQDSIGCGAGTPEPGLHPPRKPTLIAPVFEKVMCLADELGDPERRFAPSALEDFDVPSDGLKASREVGVRKNGGGNIRLDECGAGLNILGHHVLRSCFAAGTAWLRKTKRHPSWPLARVALCV